MVAGPELSRSRWNSKPGCWVAASVASAADTRREASSTVSPCTVVETPAFVLPWLFCRTHCLALCTGFFPELLFLFLGLKARRQHASATLDQRWNACLFRNQKAISRCGALAAMAHGFGLPQPFSRCVARPGLLSPPSSTRRDHDTKLLRKVIAMCALPSPCRAGDAPRWLGCDAKTAAACFLPLYGVCDTLYDHHWHRTSFLAVPPPDSGAWLTVYNSQIRPLNWFSQAAATGSRPLA